MFYQRLTEALRVTGLENAGLAWDLAGAPWEDMAQFRGFLTELDQPLPPEAAP